MSNVPAPGQRPQRFGQAPDVQVEGSSVGVCELFVGVHCCEDFQQDDAPNAGGSVCLNHAASAERILEMAVFRKGSFYPARQRLVDEAAGVLAVAVVLYAVPLVQVLASEQPFKIDRVAGHEQLFEQRNASYPSGDLQVV